MNSNNRKLISLVLLLGIFNLTPQVTKAEDISQNTLQGLENSGVQLNNTLSYLERQRILKRITEEQAKRRAIIEDNQEKTQGDGENEIKFNLNQIIVSPSKVLSQDEINQVSKLYIGKEISLQDLYAITDKLNDLYTKKGYITCKAILKPQRIKNGVVHITLIEGKTGKINIVGNDTTTGKYILDRIPLKNDDISNIYDMNEDLLRFNATNDVQLRISMQAGEQEGTTDYVITAIEPKKETISVYADNAGSDSSGIWREGIFYNNRSLNGHRDSLNISTMFSEGTNSVSAMYQTPIGHSGTKLVLSYSTNSIHIIDGDLEDMDVQGHSSAFSLSFIQPLRITEDLRTEVNFDYGYQNSQTDFLGIHWVDDTANNYTLGYSIIDYGDSSVIYQKHNYRVGGSQDIMGESTDYGKYMFNGLYQKGYTHGQMLSTRLDGQWSSTNYLPSVEQFYIGGAYSVRGYKESLLGGDSGFSASLEYSVPLDKNKTTSMFTFFDYGQVLGASAFDDHILAGAGIGLKSIIDQRVYTSLTLGVPLMRELNGTQVSKTRLHFMINGQF